MGAGVSSFLLFTFRLIFLASLYSRLTLFKLLLHLIDVGHIISLKTDDCSKELIVEFFINENGWIVELVLCLAKQTVWHVEQHTLLIALVALVHIDILGLVMDAELLLQCLLVLLLIVLVLLLFKDRILGLKELFSLLAFKHGALTFLALLLFLFFLLTADILFNVIE